MRRLPVGDEVEAFSRQHRAALTGQQFQSAENEPYYVLFEDFTHVTSDFRQQDQRDHAADGHGRDDRVYQWRG